MRAIILTVILFSTTMFCQDSKDSDMDIDTTSNYFLFDYIKNLHAEDYYSLLDSVKKGKSNDFFTLRMAFTKLESYSYYSLDFKDERNEIIKSLNAGNHKAAEKTALGILDSQFIYMPVHLFLGYIYRETGDSIKSQFHYKVYDELAKSMLTYSDGKSFEYAIIVVSTKEEYHFMDWLGAHRLEQQLISHDGYSFDKMLINHESSKDSLELYFNISIPFTELTKQFDKESE